MSLPLPFRKKYPIGPFIKSHLERVGRASGREMYRAYKREALLRGYPPGKYKSFARTLFYLTYLGFIRVLGKRPIPGRGVPETVYGITSRGKRAPITEWSNPAKTYYLEKGIVWIDPVTGEPKPIVSLGTRRYRRKIMGIPPKPRGRPRKRLE